MAETRKLAAILAADVVGYSRLVGADEDGTVARIRALRSELIDPAIASNRGRIVKTTGDGILIEFASVVDAVHCTIEVQKSMAQRNAKLGEDRRIDFRVGIHLGDVIVQADGDLMGDGVNIAARLEGIAEPGGICLSEDAHRQVRDKIAANFTDLGDKELKNIARPMRAYAVQGSETTRTPTHQGFAPSPCASPLLGPVSSPPRLSIVVLPFANIGGDPDQEYFVDGVTESLTTDLSRISGSFVIARNTAFTYKGKHVDVKQIGRELNVRYVLEGSVQRGGSRLRVNVQLIDAETGNYLWAERFDKPLADLFDMQDEIVARLANQISTELIVVEARRAERSPHPDSMDLYFQGMAFLNHGPSLENLSQARAHFERAVALDPANVDALVGMAAVDYLIGAGYMSDDHPARLAAAEAAVTKVLSLAPNDARAHMYLGGIQTATGRATQGLAECERALVLDRNLARARAHIGYAKILLGRAEEIEDHTVESLRLSPRDSVAYTAMFIAGAAKMLLGKDEEAVAWLRRSIEANRNFRNTHVILAAALAQLGRLDEARAAVQAALALDPSLTVRRYRAGIVSDNPTFLAQLERGIDGMRKAGVPEGGERSAIFALQTGCGVRWRDFCNGSMLVKKSTNER